MSFSRLFCLLVQGGGKTSCVCNLENNDKLERKTHTADKEKYS